MNVCRSLALEMASDNGEPSPKKSRSGEMGPSIRYIKLDMANYDSWVQDYSDNDLVKIFELGLKVKESASLRLEVNQKIVEDALDSKMKPVHDSVTRIEKQVEEQVKRVQENVADAVSTQMSKFSENVEGLKKKVSDHMTTIEDKLTGRVDTVAQKVQPLDKLNSAITTSAESIKTQVHQEVQDSEIRVKEQLGEWKQKLDSISNSLEKPSNKGARAERNVITILKDHLQPLNYTFLDTARDQGKGDIEAQTPNGHKIMIEVKQWEAALSRSVIEKFEKNLKCSPDFNGGILLSMTSGIARRSQEGRFEIAFDQSQKQYQVYVPNAYANNEEYLIVWSVVMVAQLAKIDGELGERKTQGLDEIYKKFVANIKHSQDCKSSLDALKNSVKNLEDSIQPILKTVEETKNAIYKLLHS